MRPSHTILVVGIVQEQLADTLWAARAKARQQARCRKEAKEAEENQGCATEHSTTRSVSPALCLLPCGSLIVAVAPAVAVPANMSSTTCVGTRVEIIGLQKRPDLNGVAGTCVEYDQTEQRWDVKVLIGESTCMKRFRLKTNNLIVTAPASVNEGTQPPSFATPATTLGPLHPQHEVVSRDT